MWSKPCSQYTINTTPGTTRPRSTSGEKDWIIVSQPLLSQVGLVARTRDRRNPAGDVELLVVQMKSRAKDQTEEKGENMLCRILSIVVKYLYIN